MFLTPAGKKTDHTLRITDHGSRITDHGSRITDHGSHYTLAITKNVKYLTGKIPFFRLFSSFSPKTVSFVDKTKGVLCFVQTAAFCVRCGTKADAGAAVNGQSPPTAKKPPVPAIIVVSALVLVAVCGAIAVKDREDGVLKPGQGYDLVEDGVPKTGRDYDLVRWGSSPEKVRSAYGISDTVQLRHLEGDGDSIFSLVHENVSEAITKRIFKFSSGELLVVQVFYAKPVKPDSVMALLTGEYGPRVERPNCNRVGRKTEPLRAL
jgi:hypothetical protein